MGYIDEARTRALRRKSPWNLILLLAALIPWALLWYISAALIGCITRHLHPGLNFVLLPNSGGGTLIAIGLCFAWLPVAMILSNLVVVMVPAAKRTLDDEAREVAGTDFQAASCGLLKVMAVITPLGLFIALLGVLFA